MAVRGFSLPPGNSFLAAARVGLGEPDCYIFGLDRFAHGRG